MDNDIKCVVCGKTATKTIKDKPLCDMCAENIQGYSDALKSKDIFEMTIYVMKLEQLEMSRSEKTKLGENAKRSPTKPQKPNIYSYANIYTNRICTNIENVLEYLNNEPYYDKKVVEMLLGEAKMLTSLTYALNEIAIGDKNYGKEN